MAGGQLPEKDLNYLYSPSQFTKKYRPDEVVDRHLSIGVKATSTARQEVRCDLGIEYIPNGQTVDIYYPSDINDTTVVFIYFHGGYWQQMGLEHSGVAAIPLTKNNVILAAVGYDLAPKVNMTTIVEQCRQGCAFIVKKFPGKKIFVGGHSAGGHLAAMMLTTSWSNYGLFPFPLSGAVLLSGVYDLDPIQKCYVNDPLKLSDQEVELLSPLKTSCSRQLSQLPSGFLCLIAEGEQESPAFKRQREEYSEVLSANGVNVTLHEILDEDHFSLVDRLEEEDYTLTKILIKFLLQN